MSMSIYRLLLFVISLRLCNALRASWKPLPEDDAGMLQRLYNLTGGEQQLPSIIKQIEQAASELRNSTPCSMDPKWLHGSFGMVAPVTFNDGVKWAVKVGEHDLDEMTVQAVNVAKAIERNCPAIPIPRPHGEIQWLENNTHMYHFMDWVEGTPLYEDPQYHANCSHPRNATDSVIFTLPEKTVIDLAEFIYNLTTCPIPENECK